MVEEKKDSLSLDEMLALAGKADNWKKRRVVDYMPGRFYDASIGDTEVIVEKVIWTYSIMVREKGHKLGYYNGTDKKVKEFYNAVKSKLDAERKRDYDSTLDKIRKILKK